MQLGIKKDCGAFFSALDTSHSPPLSCSFGWEQTTPSSYNSSTAASFGGWTRDAQNGTSILHPLPCSTSTLTTRRGWGRQGVWSNATILHTKRLKTVYQPTPSPLSRMCTMYERRLTTDTTTALTEFRSLSPPQYLRFFPTQAETQCKLNTIVRFSDELTVRLSLSAITTILLWRIHANRLWMKNVITGSFEWNKSLINVSF